MIALLGCGRHAGRSLEQLRRGLLRHGTAAAAPTELLTGAYLSAAVRAEAAHHAGSYFEGRSIGGRRRLDRRGLCRGLLIVAAAVAPASRGEGITAPAIADAVGLPVYILEALWHVRELDP
jgi:hypothetical protein